MKTNQMSEKLSSTSANLSSRWGESLRVVRLALTR